MMNKQKSGFNVMDIIILAAAVLYWAGIRYLFPVCNPMSDMVMSCHWAGETLKAVSWLFAGLAVCHLLIPDGRMKSGMDIAMAAAGIFAVFVPGTIISICGDSAMHCHTTRLWTAVFGICWIVLSLADLLVRSSAESKEKHRRPVKEENS